MGNEVTLTKRQTQVVKLIGDGWTIKQIAGLFGIAETCADYHKQEAMKRIGVNHTPGLVKFAIRSDLTSL